MDKQALIRHLFTFNVHSTNVYSALPGDPAPCQVLLEARDVFLYADKLSLLKWTKYTPRTNR